MDEQSIMEFAFGVATNFSGMTVATGVWIGDELGLYRAMADGAPRDGAAVAAATGCNERLVEEWLRGQTAAGFVQRDADGTYRLGPEAVMVLADDTSPVFMARGAQTLGSVAKDFELLVEAFRSDGAMSWGEHHPCLFKGVEWFFRPGYRASLVSEWIPALDGVQSRLEVGGAVADVGCGHGASTILIADAFPNSRVTGIDFHGPSIETAKGRATEAGVVDRIDFQVADAKSYEGTFDLIAFFDCLHDMGDPIGAMRHARSRLTDGGSVLLVEPFALDGVDRNIAENPIAAMMYHGSAFLCTPNSLSQEGAFGLGGQGGAAALRDIALEAGFESCDVRAQTPFNLILQVV